MKLTFNIRSRKLGHAVEFERTVSCGHFPCACGAEKCGRVYVKTGDSVEWSLSYWGFDAGHFEYVCRSHYRRYVLPGGLAARNPELSA